MHSVYKITVGDFVYIGYTSRPPKVRLEEHLEMARKQNWKHNSKLYPELVENEYEHEFEIVEQYETEQQALMREILEISRLDPIYKLNLSKGGEGSTMTLKVITRGNTTAVKVIPKNRKKPKRRPRRRNKRKRR